MIADTTIQTDRDALLDELREAGADVKGPTAIRCPFHDDRSPSMAVYRADDGVWRAKCHAVSCGFLGDLFDVRAKRTGQPLENVLREVGDDNRRRVEDNVPRYASAEDLVGSIPGHSAVFKYANPETGDIDLVVVRVDEPGGKKRFIQGSRRPGGQFVMKAPPKPWPLYNRARISAAEHVIVVEGEKCVHALHRAGLVATTSPAGAGKAVHADWSPLAGKVVFLWPDNDNPGEQHMRDVAKLLEELSPRPLVRWIDPADLDLPPKGDVADLIGDAEHEVAVDLVDTVLAGARSLSATAGLEQLLRDTVDGKRVAIDWLWDVTSQLTKALLPGTVTLVCGRPGSSKSFFVLEAGAEWHRQGIPVALFMLEDSRAYHLSRALAQLTGMACMFDDAWMRANGELVEAHFVAHRNFLDSFGNCIFDAPDQIVTYDDILAWTERRLDAGARIVVVDPITIAAPSQRPWIEDQKFIDRAKKLMVAHGASLILVNHPKIGTRHGVGLEHIAGGAAFPRFSQTVLWLEELESDDTTRNVQTPFGVKVVEANRVLLIAKARSGKGSGVRIAFDFNAGGTLRFREHGIVVKS